MLAGPVAAPHGNPAVRPLVLAFFAHANNLRLAGGAAQPEGAVPAVGAAAAPEGHGARLRRARCGSASFTARLLFKTVRRAKSFKGGT